VALLLPASWPALPIGAAQPAPAPPLPAQVVPEGQSWEVERNILNNHFKGISIYCGR
jgi:hypothetical protein